MRAVGFPQARGHAGKDRRSDWNQSIASFSIGFAAIARSISLNAAALSPRPILVSASYNQSGNERRKFFCYTQWLSQSAWVDHDGSLPVWSDD